MVFAHVHKHGHMLLPSGRGLVILVPCHCHLGLFVLGLEAYIGHGMSQPPVMRRLISLWLRAQGHCGCLHSVALLLSQQSVYEHLLASMCARVTSVFQMKKMTTSTEVFGRIKRKKKNVAAMN